MKQYAIGLDNGGTMTKAALFDLSRTELCVAARKTPVCSPQPGYSERDMESLWQANCACIREIFERSAISPEDVLGIAVCGHGKGLYLWGNDDKPAYQGIGSTDNRAWEIVQQWYEDDTHGRVYPQICQQIMPCQQAPLLRWIKQHCPEVYANIQYVFSVKDYIRFRLTGEAWSEATDISGSHCWMSGMAALTGHCWRPWGSVRYTMRCPDGIYRRGGNVVVFCNNGSVYIEQNQISTHRFHSNSNRYCLASKISGM